MDNEVFTIYYSPECPYADYAKEKNKDYFIKIDLLEKSKNAFCIFNNGANFYKSEFISNKCSFEKLIK